MAGGGANCKLPKEQPVVYTVKSDGDRNNCIGVAKRGRVQEQLA